MLLASLVAVAFSSQLREMERRVGEREAEATALRKDISESGGGKEGLKRRLEEKEAQISRLRAQKVRSKDGKGQTIIHEQLPLCDSTRFARR